MRNYRNSVLAGVAVIALAAGTGLASAQMGTQQGSQSGATGEHTQSGSRMGGAMGHGAQSGNEQAQGTHHGSMSAQGMHEKNGKTAQGTHAKNGKTAEGMHEKNGRTAKGTHENGNKSTQGTRENGGRNAQRGNENGNARNTAEGRGNQEGRAIRGVTTEQNTNVHLSDHQRTRIRETVINARGAPRVGHVKFDVRVGTVIPRGRIHIVTVPETLVRIEPRWRGFLYFVYEDEVVIVNPHSYRIVAIVPA